MELVLVIYLIDLMAGINYILPLFIGVVGLLSIALVAMAIHDFASKDVTDSFRNKLPKILKIWATLLTASVFLAWLTPSRETSYAMLAAYGVQTVAEVEKVQEVAGKSLKVLERYMDDYLEESSKDE